MWEMIQIVNSTKVWINAHISLLTEPYSTIWQISHYAVFVDSSSHTHSVSYLSVSPAAGRQQQQSQSWEPENRHASHPSRPAGHRLESATAFTQRKDTVFEPKNTKLNVVHTSAELTLDPLCGLVQLRFHSRFLYKLNSVCKPKYGLSG